jgi:hypothetical protein
MEDNIRLDLMEIILEVLAWIHLAQGREYRLAVVSTVMNLWVPKKAGNFLTS